MIYKTIFILLFLAVQSGNVFAAEIVGSGQTNDGKKAILYSDGTWQVEPEQKATKSSSDLSYESIKRQVVALCADDEVKDATMSAVNMWQTIAARKGISKEKYWSCLSKATGCMELTSLTMQCGGQ